MRAQTCFRFTLPLLLLLLGLGCGGSGDPMGPGGTPDPDPFDPTTLEPQMLGVGEFIYDIAGNESGVAFAIGRQGLILAFIGAEWVPVEMPPNTVLESTFIRVWVDDAGVAYFVGDGVFATYDHGSWTFQNVPEFDQPVAIWGRGPDDIYVLEFDIYHYDGRSWAGETLPDGVNRLTDLTGFGGMAVAVGFGGQVLQKATGDRWAFLDIGTTNDLWAIYKPDADENYVIGADSYFVRFSSLGTSEPTEIAAPDDARRFVINGTEAKDIYLAGDAMYRFDGQDFTRLGDAISTLDCRSLWVSPDRDIYVGSNAFESVLRFSESSWFGDPRTIRSIVSRAWGDGLGTVMLSNRGILTLTDGAITPTANFGGFIGPVWGSSADDVWAGVVSGPLVRYQDGGWSGASRPGSWRIESIWGRSADEVYATGVGGNIIRFDGTRWVPMDSPTTETLNTVVGTADMTFARGGDTVLRLVEGTWIEDSLPTNGLRELQLIGPSLVVANDDLNLYIARADGWETVPIPTALLGYEFKGSALDDLFVMRNDEVGHFDGESIRVLPAVSTRGIEDFAVIGSHDLWVFGRNVVRYVAK